MMPSEEVYGTEQLRQSPFVEKVMPDPAHPTSVAPWLGLLGKSTNDGYWRLYLTIELDSYIEFKEEDVLAFDIIPPKQSPLEVEAARVYLEPSARIKHVRTQSWEGEARQGQAGTTMAGAVPEVLSGRRLLQGPHIVGGVDPTGAGARGVLARQSGGGGKDCGSTVTTALVDMPGGGLQFCDFLVTCTDKPEGRVWEFSEIEGSCSGNILERRGSVAQILRERGTLAQ
jgi:hypothetical protein